jgi:hypothetical protein
MRNKWCCPRAPVSSASVGKVLKLLFERGTDVHAVNGEGQAPYEYRWHMEMERLLVWWALRKVHLVPFWLSRKV